MDETMKWDIGRTGRSWAGPQGLAKLERLPGRLEMIDGKVCSSEAERRELLSGLLENLGIDAVVQFGRVEDWQQAIVARAEANRNPVVSTAAKTPARHWNCRVIEFPSEDETWYAIHEVYYDHGLPVAYGASAADPGWTMEDGPDAGLDRLEKFKEALRKPVLKEVDFTVGRMKLDLLGKLGQMIEQSGGAQDVATLLTWLDDWLAQPHSELDGWTPAQALASEDGRRQVEALLERARDCLPVKAR
ncbi:MAG: hypothetical protein C0423_09155 [Methylibium sp.]|nr:hypothetical protein [Methylibium sp.]